jgi:hypothetical protein
MSCYNLDEADVADQRQRFALCEAEVRSRRVACKAVVIIAAAVCYLQQCVAIHVRCWLLC